MLGQKAIKRLLDEIKLHENNDEAMSSFRQFLLDIKLVCRAVEIYRDLSAANMWGGTGDETPHTEYLVKSDEYACKRYRREYANKRNAGTSK